MSNSLTPAAPHPLDAAAIERELEKLRKINGALMRRVERSMDQQGNAYSLFQTAISLEGQVRARTEELKSALNRLEKINGEMAAARDAAEQANRFKTRFFTAVGHDLLQPLHAARLSVSALSESGDRPADVVLTRQIDHALTSIEDILRTILDLSKLEAGVIKPSLQPVDLDRLFQSVISDLGPLAARKSLTLTSRKCLSLVLSDPLLLRRIIQNLLANAVNYTADGGVKLAARRRGRMIRIEVWDTGPGIPEAERKSIFEEFQRGAASESAKRAGFGLGLSIAQRMAETLSHPLGLCTKVGKGTMFHVSAPAVEQRDAATYAAAGQMAHADSSVAPALYGFSGVEVLVVENELAVHAAMKTLLERWSCRISFASSMAELSELLARPDFRPAIILADYHLDHGETGLDAILSVRASRGDDVPAVVITADYTEEVATRVASHCDILRKPVRPAELRALMHHLLV